MSESESNEEFLRRLSRDFTAQRWLGIFEEVHGVFVHYMKTRLSERVQELVAGMNETAPHLAGDASLVGFAYAQATAEGALAAVAHYLATHDPPAATEL